jgi:chromosome segregation ATPase
LPPQEIFETLRDDAASPALTVRAASAADDLLAERVQHLEELAYALRDEGIGTPELSERVAILVEAYDTLVGNSASLQAVRRSAGDLEMTARLREARLAQALNQLERELADAEDRPDPQRERLRARAAALTQRITHVGFELAEQLDAIEERTSRLRQLVGPLRAEVEQQLQLLHSLLARWGRELGDRCPPPLRRLLSGAGIER